MTAWLETKRLAGERLFTETGLPTRKTEHWRYTPVTLIEQGEFNSQTADLANANVPAELLADIPAPRAVMVNGQYATEYSDLTGCEAVFVADIPTAIAQHSERLEGSLCATDFAQKIAGRDYQHPFAEQNTARFTDGVVVILPDDAVVEATLHIVNIVTTANNLAHQRNIIVLGDNAKLNLVMHALASTGDAYFNNIVNEIQLGENAELTHNKLQQEGGRGLHVAMTQVTQNRGSQYRHFNFDLGGRLVRNDVVVQLNAPEAHCDLQGLAVQAGRQHIDNHTWIHHNTPDCTSNEYYKAILAGKSHNVFNGYVQVAKEAQHTDSNMQNKSLLLSRDAEVDTKPELEIYADDVKCAHGATIGELDENALFYLRSRGIPTDKAKALLTYAFASEIVDHAPDDGVRERVLCALSTKLDDHGVIREMIR